MPPGKSNQKSLPSPQSNTVIFPPISQTIQFFEPSFVSVRGSKNRDFSSIECDSATLLRVAMLLLSI